MVTRTRDRFVVLPSDRITGMISLVAFGPIRWAEIMGGLLIKSRNLIEFEQYTV
jgi:hypothetical protein